MAETRKGMFQPLRITFQRSTPARVRPPITIRTFDPVAVLPVEAKPMHRYRSEPHTHKPKIASKRTLRPRMETEDSNTSLVIQSSQPTLLQIAQVLTARERATRSPDVLEKYNRHVHLPLVKPDAPLKTSLLTTTLDDHRSIDSNEQDIDLKKFIRDRPTINLKEITIGDVFSKEADGELSPLTAVNKAFELRTVPPSKSLVSMSLQHTSRKSTPKPSFRGCEKVLALKALQPHRFSVEQNAHNRIRWMQKHKAGLRPLVDL